MCFRTWKNHQKLRENEENLAIFTVILIAAFGTKNVHSALCRRILSSLLKNVKRSTIGQRFFNCHEFFFFRIRASVPLILPAASQTFSVVDGPLCTSIVPPISKRITDLNSYNTPFLGVLIYSKYIPLFYNM